MVMFSITNSTLETSCILLKCLFLFSVPSSFVMTITMDKLSRNQLKQEKKIDTQALHPLTRSVTASSSAMPNGVTYSYSRTVKDQNSGNPPLVAYGEQSNCKESAA